MLFVRKTLLGNGSLPEEAASFSPPAPESGSSRVPKSVTVSAELSFSSDSMDSVPVLPPPPSFKSVTFAPGVSEDESSGPSIPMEGLPVGPAKDKQKSEDK